MPEVFIASIFILRDGGIILKGFTFILIGQSDTYTAAAIFYAGNRVDTFTFIDIKITAGEKAPVSEYG